MSRALALVLFAAAVVLLASDPALAAPGGKIARAAFESFWGRVLLAVLVIVFAPLIVLSLLKERRAARKASADLTYLARLSPAFRWIDLRERALACFHRVHAAWSREDVSEAGEFMTDWYWQNQQLVVLDRWAAEGLVNHCDVKSVSKVKAILVDPATDRPDFEGSKVVLAISANMRDYLARRDTDEIVEGNRKYKDVEFLWTFALEDGQWKVSHIDESAMLDEYLEMARALPKAADAVRAPGTGA